MELSEEIREIRDLIDEFGKKELMSAYRELEPKGEFPRELVAKISEMGLMGISFPEEYGGMGMNTVATSVAGERLAFYWPSLQLIWSANVSLAGFPIMTFGSKEQKLRFLPSLASGEILGCYALTEPGVGSDAASIQSCAELALGLGKRNWKLNGTKTFITNVGNASVGVFFARVRKSGKDSVRKHEGITAFLLASDEPGLRVNGVSVNKINKWGLRCSHFYEVVLQDVALPGTNMLGKGGTGFHIAMETLNNGRINIASQAVGIARRALREAKEYAKMRRAFGKRLIDIDVRAFKLAEFEAEVDAAWELTLAASRAKDAGEDYRYLASKAKLVATEIAVQCALENYRVQGGYGYTTDSIAMSILHDALATITYEGTSDIQKLTIAKNFQN